MGHPHVAAALSAISTLTVCVSSATARTTSDQPDHRPRTQQIHLVYAVPGDGPDRGYDVDGSIATSFAVAQAWLSGQTGGKAFVLDTAGGAADITFARLSQSDAEVASHGLYMPDFIASELRARGLSDPWKIYLVYYDGSAYHNECGGAPSPGHVAALYLRGESSDPAIPACDANPFATAGQPPGYRGLPRSIGERLPGGQPSLCSSTPSHRELDRLGVSYSASSPNARCSSMSMSSSNSSD